MIEEKEIKYKMNNICLISILLIVLCQFIEIVERVTPNHTLHAVYKAIYAFHIPMYVFIIGYYSKKETKKEFIKYILIYFIFQTIYCFFVKQPIQYTKPYWILWLVFIMPIYSIINLGYNKLNKKWQIAGIIISIAISLIVGYIKEIGYEYSLSRIFTFLPYFLLGIFMKNNNIIEKVINKKGIFAVIARILPIILIGLSIYGSQFITARIFHGSYSYEALKYNPLVRLEITLMAFSWIAFFIMYMPSIKFDRITVLGENTIIIYLLSGFIAKLVTDQNIFTASIQINIALAISFAIVIITFIGAFTVLISKCKKQYLNLEKK